MKTESKPVYRCLGALMLFLAALGYSRAQDGEVFPLNTLDPEMQQAIEINGVSFRELSESQGDEGAIAALCKCPYSVLKSEDPDLPWAAYTLFEGERRFSVSFGGDGSMGITHLELLGASASVTLNGVTLSQGDPVHKLGQIRSQRPRGGGPLHVALFSAGPTDAFFQLQFEPESGEIQRIGYVVPF